ncbi:AMP-binding protein [Actinomadura sp. SCN-SB]|uniref:AMP-binding protein n=1 Tax=Actinomadura sp. SCN-SB TaxID=3373092 RepID=UPI003750F573
MAAVWLCGGVVLPVVTTLGPRDLAFILRQSGARPLCVPGRWRDKDYTAQALDLVGLPDLARIVVLDDEPPEGTLGWDGLAAASPLTALPGRHPDEVCLLIYTSGMTSEPKGVQHTHNSVLAAGRHAAGTERTLAMFPSGHIAGLLGSVMPLLRGGFPVIMERWSAAASREVEDLLVLHPGIAEAAVCAEPDPPLGEWVCAFVLASPGAHIDLDAVRSHFAGLGVARHKVPGRVAVVSDLPRTAMERSGRPNCGPSCGPPSRAPMPWSSGYRPRARRDDGPGRRRARGRRRRV